jgi:uncharacterized protein YegL
MSRRLPIFLLLDTSGSMMGEPIEALKNGLQVLVSSLRQDPYALETVHLSVITFDSKVTQIVPLTELVQFQPPSIAASGSTNLGDALKLVAEKCQTEVRRNVGDQKGDWKPLIFLMTDGAPDGGWEKGLAVFEAARKDMGIVVACAAGSGASTAVLQRITESVVRLDTADSKSISAYFKWVSSSISAGSVAVEKNQEATGLKDLPPPPPELNVVC